MQTSSTKAWSGSCHTPVCVHAEGRFLGAFGRYLSTVESAAKKHRDASRRCSGVTPKSSSDCLRDDGTIARKQRQGNKWTAPQNQHRVNDTQIGNATQLFSTGGLHGIPGSRDVSVDFYFSPTLTYVECFRWDIWFHAPGRHMATAERLYSVISPWEYRSRTGTGDSEITEVTLAESKSDDYAMATDKHIQTTCS
jgi:hypothetical protein